MFVSLFYFILYRNHVLFINAKALDKPKWKKSRRRKMRLNGRGGGGEKMPFICSSP